MNVIHRPDELANHSGAVCVAIGMFDGVHLGHQEILRQTVEEAAKDRGVAVAFTFDRHPNAVVAPSRTPSLIYPLPQRLAVIGSCGIHTTWLIHFDAEFSRQTGEEFISRAAAGFRHLRSISIGRDFTFGHKRSGNVALLRSLGDKLGFQVHDLPPVGWNGQLISSTRIRQALREGDLPAAQAMLGRPYSVVGHVLHGEELGRKLGFPTANVDITGLQLPPPGVYAGTARVRDQIWNAAANLGYRPTLSQPHLTLRLEVHLLDFSGDLYGQELEFTFGRKVRNEQKFPSLEALRHQISQDVAAVRESA